MKLITKIFCLVLLFVFSPLFIIITLIIICDDGAPIFFKQKRIGLNNKPFFIFKFRTMKKNTPNIATHLIKEVKNHYTKTGPILRKFSLDELPQLINILKGDMSFIGPRPALFNQYDLIHLRNKRGVQHIMPGITGWAQVNGRDELDLQQKVDFDSYYLKNKSLALDLKILLFTLLKTLRTDGVKN